MARWRHALADEVHRQGEHMHSTTLLHFIQPSLYISNSDTLVGKLFAATYVGMVV